MKTLNCTLLVVIIIIFTGLCCALQIVNQREGATNKIFKQKEFNLQSLGIGGMTAEFADIFRRAFASRIIPPHFASK